MISKSIQNVKADFPDVKVKKINVDTESETAEIFGVRSIPMLVFVKNNEIVNTSIGAIDEDSLRFRIQECLL